MTRKSRISFSINKKQGNVAGDENSAPIRVEGVSSTNQQTANLKASSYFACRFCCKRFKNEQGYDTHSKSTKHKKSYECGKEFEVKKSRTCTTCQQVFDTRLQLTAHCKKQNHLPLLQRTESRNPVYGKPCTEVEQEDPFVSIKYYSPYYCEVCDLDCVNVLHYNDHVKGQRHVKTAEKRAEQSVSSLVDLDTSEVNTSEKCLAVLNKIVPISQSVSAYYCGICDMDCRSEVAYTEHVTSKEHQVRMEGHGQMTYKCDLCCMTFTSENNHKVHFKSKKHANNVAARQRLLPLEQQPDSEKESMQDLRDKIKRTISPPLKNFDKIKVNISSETKEDLNSRSVVVDINADEEDAMAMGMPKVTLDKKEKKELERKLKEDEEERGRWAKKREEEYGKKKAEILKASKWVPKVATSDSSKKRGRGPLAYEDKYKWVAPDGKSLKEKFEKYSKDSRYSKDDSRERSKEYGSRDRHSREDSLSKRREKRGNKSERRRKDYEDEKYTSDSDTERVIIKKGSSKDDENNEDLRKVINKQRGIIENDNESSLVIDYGHQRGDYSGERSGLKGFFGGAFAHLKDREEDTVRKLEKEEGYLEKKSKTPTDHEKKNVFDDERTAENVEESEKDVNKDMERTLLLELLKRQFPDIRYLAETQGGLELMQKIFGSQGMSGLASLGVDSVTSSENKNEQSLKLDENIKEVGETVDYRSSEKYQSKKKSGYSRDRSIERRRSSRSRSDSRERRSSSKKQSSSRKRSRSLSRERHGKRSRRTPSPEKRKRYEKSSSNADVELTEEKKKKHTAMAETKAKSLEAKDKALAKWTVSNWSGGNNESGKDNRKVDIDSREKGDKKEYKKSERRDEKIHKESSKDNAKRKDESTYSEESDKKRHNNSDSGKIFDDASDYEEMDLGLKIGTKDRTRSVEKSRSDDHKDKRRSEDGINRKDSRNREDVDRRKDSGSRSRDDKRRDSDERDEKRRKKSHDRNRSRDVDNDESKEMDELQRDLLANLARVENLGRVIPPSFPIGGGPLMPPVPPLTGPRPPIGLLPSVGVPYPTGSALGSRVPTISSTKESQVPFNSSALTYIRPNEPQKSSSRTSTSTDQALKNLLSQVSALGSGTKTTLSKSLGVGGDDQLHRLGERYSDDQEMSDDMDDSGSRPLKSILKKSSKFTPEQSDEAHKSSGLPKNVVGAEYVVNTGEQAKYFCQLCDVQFATLSAKNLHLRGPKHLAMFMKHKSPLIDEMIQQAMGVGTSHTDGTSVVETEENKAKKSHDFTASQEPKQDSWSEVDHHSLERSGSPFVSGASQAYTDRKSGTNDDGRRGDNLLVPGTDEQSLTTKLVVGSVATLDEYEQLSKRAKDVLSREEYAQLPASTRKLLLLENSAQSQSSGNRNTDETDFPSQPSLAGSDGNVTTSVKDYDELSSRARSLLTREEYERLPAKDKEYLSKEEYLTQEDYDRKKTQDTSEPLSRDMYESIARERERLAARDFINRESLERLDRGRRLDIDRLALADRDALSLADRDRLGYLERDRLPFPDRERLGMIDRDRLGLIERERLALAERERLSVLADRDRLAERSRLVERDYYDRYPPREDFPHRGAPDEFGRGRPIAREDYGRFTAPVDDDFRREEFARSRMRDDYGVPLLPRENFREARDPWERGPPGRDQWERPPIGRDPRDERPAPGQDFREWERSRDMYDDPRSRDSRMVPDRGGPPPGYGRRSPPREWQHGQVQAPREHPGFKDSREPSMTGGQKLDMERRPEEVGHKGMEGPGRYGPYDNHGPPGDQHEFYHDGDPRHHGREVEFDGSRRGSPSNRRGRGSINRGGPPRGHPRNAPYNRGQARRGGGGSGHF